MKKVILLLLIGGLLMTSTYAKTIVCFFSCTGNTKALAQTTAKALDADIFEIVPEVPYTDADLDWHDSKSRTSKEANDGKSRPAIKTLRQAQGDKGNAQGDGKAFDLSKYDTVVLAFPIYWGTAPKIMWTFVEQNDLSGKNVVAICTSGGSGIRGAEKDLKAHASKSANWKRGARFYANTRESELKKYFEKVLK